MNTHNPAFENLSLNEKIFVDLEVQKDKKDSTLTWLLWWIGGVIGAHRYYHGKTGTAIAMTLITLLTFGIGLIVTGIWALIDLFFISDWLREDQIEVEKKIINQVLLNRQAKATTAE